jgi:hypothetical protein
LGRISLAFRAFFQLLFHGELTSGLIQELGLSRAKTTAAAAKSAAPATPPPPQVKVTDGALQFLGILQRDSRIVDFLMEDISSYDDDQVGAAVRDLHKQARETLDRYLELTPVIDGVEGTPARVETALVKSAEVKLLGNVPADGKVSTGTLRHKGWRAVRMELPPIAPGTKPAVIAPAEIEIE